MKLHLIVLTIFLLTNSYFLRKVKKNKLATKTNKKSNSKTKTPGLTAYTKITQNVEFVDDKVILSSCGYTAGWVMKQITGVDSVTSMARVNLDKFSFCSLISCRGSKVPKTTNDILEDITSRLDQNHAILIDVVREHWFVIFKKDATHTYLIQSFQGYYTLNQWLDQKGAAGILTKSFLEEFGIFIDSTIEQEQRFEAAKNLFTPEGLITEYLTNDNRLSVVSTWFKNSMRLNGIVSAALNTE